MKKTKAQQRQDLLQYAEAELHEFGFVKSPQPRGYDFIGQTKAGPISVSIIPDEGRARNKPASISLMMCFGNVEAALKAGFVCNQFSGKYNWMFIADKNEIYRIIAGLMPEKPQDTPAEPAQEAARDYSKPAPGPWHNQHGQIYEEASGDADTICTMMDEGDTATAALIAAAPDLLAALKAIVNDAEPGEDAKLSVEGYNKACAAINRAEGGQQ